MSQTPANGIVVEGLENARMRGDAHLAIGMFDGVHLGHQAVIESAVRAAQGGGGDSGVLTFFPHPSRILTPDRATRLLQAREAKNEVLLQRLGVGWVIWQRFTTQLATVPAGAFVPYLRQFIPSLKAIHVGENFRYGQKRAGDIDTLIAEANPVGVRVFSVQRLRVDGEPISSSRIRRAVESGEMAFANSLLGYSYFCEGRIVAGRQLGRKLGFPTVNLPWSPECRPGFGVYAVRLHSARLGNVPAVANYGVRPTVSTGSEDPLLEIHTLQPIDLEAGEEIRVEWLTFLRPEMRFPSPDALREQIGKDVEAAHAYFGMA